MSDFPSRRDAGMTLPELLICIVVVGLISTVIAAAISVVLRAEPGTAARLNVARAEQSIATWMPADLSSATSADEDPAASPCGAPTCPGIGAIEGSNALMLSWPANGGTTTVSYRYQSAGSNDLYDLVRIECSAGTCNSVTVLHDLEGPPSGAFAAGTDSVPANIFDVSVPLGAGAEQDIAANYAAANSTASRIVVSINGAAGRSGSSLGSSRISITAGGTALGTLDPELVTGPSFIQARSRCGGPITLIVDESRSVGSDISQVRQGVRDFVNALSGTPTQVQIVRFESLSSVLGSTDWNKYFDMADPAQVDALTNTSTGHINQLTSTWAAPARGGTNWEEAMFRTFRDSTGARLDNDGDPTTSLPNLVVFFTDGIPTLDRLNPTNRTGSLLADPPAVTDPKWPKSVGYTFSQEAWNRANHIAGEFRSSVRMVGVGVGTGISAESFTFLEPVRPDASSPTRNMRYAYRTNEPRVQAHNSSGNWAWIDSFSFGWWANGRTPNKKILGNLIVGGDVTNDADEGWVESTWDGTSWTDADIADLIITPDWSRFDEALTSIALGQCGGTLTLQTKLQSTGGPAQTNVTYESGGETVTTSRISRAAAFDVTVTDGTSVNATVTPQSLDSTGYVAQSWSCNAAGVSLAEGADWSLVTPGVPADGVTVTVAANKAVSCTMTVAPA